MIIKIINKASHDDQKDDIIESKKLYQSIMMLRFLF